MPLFDRRSPPTLLTSEPELLRELLADVRRWVGRYAGPRSDLDDLVQESMIELVSALDRFRGESSVRTFAHRVALRATARELKKRRASQRRLELTALLDPIGQSNPERELSERQAMQVFYDALAQLSDKRRNAVVLCAIEKLPHEEAAAVEGVSVETLRARLKHGRADLERTLARAALRSSSPRGGPR